MSELVGGKDRHFYLWVTDLPWGTHFALDTIFMACKVLDSFTCNELITHFGPWRCMLGTPMSTSGSHDHCMTFLASAELMREGLHIHTLHFTLPSVTTPGPQRYLYLWWICAMALHLYQLVWDVLCPMGYMHNWSSYTGTRITLWLFVFWCLHVK